MNLKVIWTSRFKKDYKLAIKRNLNIELLDDVIRMLAAGQTLPEEYTPRPTPAAAGVAPPYPSPAG